MKKFNLFLAAAAMIGMSASAQDANISFSVENDVVTVAPGEQLTLPLYISTDVKIRDFQLTLTTPEGFDVVKSKGKYTVKFNNDVCDTDLYNVTTAYKASGHNFLVLGYILMDTFEEICEYCIQPTTGAETFCTLTLSTPEVEGDYDFSFNDINVTLTTYAETGFAEKVKPANVDLVVKVKDASGIENVVVAGEANEGAYYDLYGRRVANPVNGIYVHNGKKVLVK